MHPLQVCFSRGFKSGLSFFKKMSFLKRTKVKFFIILLLATVFLSLAQCSIIFSESMEPNLRSGDRVFINKWAYGLRIPLSSSYNLVWKRPQRGEVVLLQSPREPQTYVKRIIGTEGDIISFEQGKLKVNGDLVKESWFSDSIDEGGDIKEIIVENEQYLVKRSKLLFERTRLEDRVFVVPEEQFFVLGDNRDVSFDSRTWGCVPLRYIYGKVSLVIFSLDIAMSYLIKFRTDRFLKKV